MNELQVVQEPRAVERLSAAQIRADVNLIQEVMRAVMVKGVHYDKIPGCGDKDVLLKPGAEKIASTFRLAIEPDVQEISTPDEIRYRVAAKVTSQANGTYLGSGIGEASTNEEKYKWRRVVSAAEWDATPEDRKRVKYSKDYTTQQVRANPSDVANTVLKMAKKRALIDAVLTITAASDIFTQDIEDLPEEVAAEVAGGKEAPIATPMPKEKTPTDRAVMGDRPDAGSHGPATNGKTPAKDRMRSMGARFAGKCRACANPVGVGDPIYYDADTKSAYHPECC